MIARRKMVALRAARPSLTTIFLLVRIRQNKPRNVPELIREMFIALYLVVAEAHVSARCVTDHECHACGVRAKLFDDIDRISAVAERFRKFLALSVTNDAGEVHSSERDSVQCKLGHENHASNPEEDEFIRRDENVRRVEAL